MTLLRCGFSPCICEDVHTGQSTMGDGSVGGQMSPVCLDLVITATCSRAQSTILISHSDKAHCYPLTHVMEAVILSDFPEETCRQSLLPTSMYNFIRIGLIRMLDSYDVSLEGVYTPYSSPELGPRIFGISEANLKASMMCGDQPLITSDLFEDSSARITQGKRWEGGGASSHVYYTLHTSRISGCTPHQSRRLSRPRPTLLLLSLPSPSSSSLFF